MVFIFFFLFFVALSQQIVPTINIGIILDLSPSFSHVSNSIYKSFKLAFLNHTIPEVDRKYNFVNKNVTSIDDCQSVAYFVFNQSVSMTFAYVNSACLNIIYKHNIEASSFLIVPAIYPFSDCIKNSVFASLYIHEIVSLLTQLYGDIIILGYLNEVTVSLEQLLLPSNYYSVEVGLIYHGLIIHSTSVETVNKIKEYLPNGGKIISLLVAEDTNELLNEMKIQSVNDIYIYSFIDTVRSVYETNNNAIGQYLLVDDIFDIKNTEFNKLYEITYGNTDIISSIEYFTFYMVKHWIDTLDQVVFYDSQIIQNAYRSDIITPEVTLYFSDNNFFFGKYFLYKVNDLNELEYVNTLGIYCAIDDRAFTPVITNITNQNLCNLEINEVKYYAIIHNYYYLDESVGIESSLDVISSELKHFYDEQNYYTLRIIENEVPNTFEELEQLINNYSSIYKIDTIFGAIDSDLLIQIVPYILYFSVEENEGNICSANVVFVNSGIYTQFHFYIAANYAIYNPPDLNRMYIIYSEGRYGDFFNELVLSEKSLEKYEIKYFQLKKDSSNVKEVVNILNSETNRHIILFASQGKCGIEFFKLYTGSVSLYSFISFSHSTPFKIFAFHININNFYFISIYSNEIVDVDLIPFDYYYIDFKMNYTIDYRLGKHLVDNLKYSYTNCSSYSSSKYKRCFEEFPSTIKETSIGYNYQAIGNPNLYKIDENKTISVYTNCPFPTVSTSYNYDLSNHSFNVCNALDKTLTLKSTVNVYIIFPIEESRTLDLLYSLFYLVENMYSKNRQNVIPLLFPMHCSFTSLECYKNVFKTLREEKTELSYLLAPLSEEFMYELEDDIKSVKTLIVNTWWYCESLCEENYFNMGDSLEQTVAGISSVLLGNRKIYQQNNVNLCIIGNNDIYTNGLYKYLKGDILYIKYKLLLYIVDETNINSQLTKINTECINSFLISTLLTTKNDLIVTDIHESIILIMIRNDEANVLTNIKEYNNTYIISTYYNELNITQNIQLHEAIDTFGNNFEAYNTTFPFSKNNHFYFPTFLLNYYIEIEYIKDADNLTILSPKGNVTVDNNPSTISNVFVIKIINETFILQHESSTPVKPFVYTTYDENKKIVYPEDILNPSNLNLFVYKCSYGVLYKHNAYNSLYLYDEESLHDFVTYFGIAAASYDLISTEHIYLRIIPFIFEDNIPAITYKDQLDKLFKKFTFTSVIGCYYEDCLLFFDDYLVDKDIPLISPYQSSGEMCLNNVIIGGTIISQEIMSLFYLLQKWTLPISIIVDQSVYSQTYMNMLKPYLEYFNVTHFINNITTADLTPQSYYYLFQSIRSDIYNGGLIVLFVDDIDSFEQMVLCFYKYFCDYDNDDDNDVPFYLLINDSPDFLYLLLSDRISYSHIYYQVNYNPRLNVEENLHYLDVTKSHLGVDTLFDDNSAVAYVFTKIIYENYVESNTTSFEVIKDTTLIKSYNTAIGPIQITKDLYIAQITYLRTYDKRSNKIIQVNEGSGIFIPTPFSPLYHHTYYVCVNGKATEFSNIVHIGVIHPYSGYYKNRYSSVIYALTLASNYFVHFLSDDVKYVMNYYDCGDSIDTFRNILHKLVEEKYVAVFGGYPSAAVRFTIFKEINNTDTSFYYLYDVNYPECYSENFIILGTVIHQKIIAIAQYLNTIVISNTILISDEYDWYINDLYDYIMKTHFMDIFSSYIFYDSSKLRLFFDEISRNNTQYAFILSTTSESAYKFYNELHQYSVLFPSFKYLVFDLNMDYFEAQQYPVELLVNNFIMSNYLPSYNLIYNSIWTNSTVFSFIKEVNISSLFYIGSYLTDFYYRRSNSVYKNNFIYYSAEGFIILDQSNYLERQIRIGKFYNNSNKIGVKLEFQSTGLKPDPFYLYFNKDLIGIVCNVYSDNKHVEVVIKKIIYLNDNSDNIFDIYTGLHYVLANENHNILLNTYVIDSDITLNINDIRQFAKDENVVAFMGCITIDCIKMIMPILTQYNKVLFSFYGDPGICSSNVITTVNSRINEISTAMNHFYARNINYFILLTDSNNNVYSNMFRSYSKILGIESTVIENPSLISLKEYLDKLLSKRVLVYNTISLLNPSIFNFLSSKSEDNITFGTTNLYYNYYYNSSYYIVNVYSVEYFVVEIDEIKENGFEDGFYRIYNHLPNQYNYIGYNAMILLFKMIELIGNFDILSNLNKIDSIVSRYLTISNSLFLTKVNENKQIELVKIYNSTIESYSTPYPWFLESQTGSICVIDFDNKTATTKKIGINRIGLTFNVNEDSEMVYTRQTVLTIVNAINYYYLTNDLNVVTMTYDCKTEDDFRNAYSELMKYLTLKIIIGYNEYKLVDEYIKNTNILYFSIHPIPVCLISKNIFSSTSSYQIIYPVIEYVINRQVIEDIIVIYSNDAYVIIDQLKDRFQNYIITYYYIDDDDYKNYIDKFMSKYIISNNTINMICMLHRNILRYFANSLCSINSELQTSINVFYCDAMTYALKDIGICSLGVENYIVGSYNRNIIKENIDIDKYIFNNNVTEILINNYYSLKTSVIPFNEEAFVGLIFVEFIKFLFLFETNSLDTLPIYSYSFPTPYGTISMSVTNTVSRTIYYTHFESNNSLIRSNLLRTYEMCYKYNSKNNQYNYVDYYNTNSERSTEYLKSIDVFPIGVIFESPIKNITFYERAYYVSIERLVISLNNGTGLMDRFMFLQQFYYKDIISTFSSLKTTIFFSIMDYSLVSQYFLPLLYLTNKIILHLLPYSGEVCENNVIFMNYFPYEIGYHITNFVISQNENLLVIYSITYSDFILPLYNQLYNYPYTTIITMPFDIKDESTFIPIHEYVNKTDEAILLLFGPVVHIDSSRFKTFINGFKPFKNIIITDLSSLQIDNELMTQLNGFYFFSSYFQSLGNESSTNLNINYAVLAEELNNFYYRIYSRDYRIEYPSYIGVTSFLILKDVLTRAGKYELDSNFFKVLNQKISVLSPYGQSTLTPGRKLEQLYFIGRYNSNNKTNNYDIKYYQDTSLFPYNFNPYLSDQKCLFTISNVEYNYDQVKLLFIFSNNEECEIGIDAFLSFLYQLNEINNMDIYNNNFIVYTKKYNTVDELKVIVTENQENYFAYITYVQPTHLEQIRYDFNKTILFSLTTATKEVMLQSNIISFSLIDSVAIDIINDQLDKLYFDKVIVVSMPKCPIYLSFFELIIIL